MTTLLQPNPAQDYLKSFSASKLLATRIETFWHKKGYPFVKAWVETMSNKEGDKTYIVRSNISFSVPTE